MSGSNSAQLEFYEKSKIVLYINLVRQRSIFATHKCKNMSVSR
jgi:hypothetical protein